jgi:hypothetical protein
LTDNPDIGNDDAVAVTFDLPHSAHSQIQKEATMQGEIYSIDHLDVEPSQFPLFQELVSRIVAATSKETNTLTYEYVVSEDHTTVHIIERYRAAGRRPRPDQPDRR